MKKILSFLLLVCLGRSVSAQQIFLIKADSTRLTGCDSNELIIGNHTQNVPGFLFNTGNGRTIFKRGAIKVNDTVFIIGGDTLKIPHLNGTGWVQGGNRFGTTGVIGTLDSNDLVFYQNGIEGMRLSTNGHLSINYGGDAGYGLTNWGSTLLTDTVTIWNVRPGASTESVLTWDPLTGVIHQVPPSAFTRDTTIYRDTTINNYFGGGGDSYAIKSGTVQPFDSTGNHWRADGPSVVSLPNGNILSLFTNFYTNNISDAGPANVFGSFSTDGGITWSTPTLRIGNITQNTSTPSVWVQSNGNVMCITNNKYLTSPLTSTLCLWKSVDSGKTFTFVDSLIKNAGSYFYTASGKVVKSPATKRLFLPLGQQTSLSPVHYVGKFLYSDDEGNTWKLSSNVVASPDSVVNEPGIYFTPRFPNTATAGEILTYYFTTQSLNTIYAAQSIDTGTTFTAPYDLGLPSPYAQPDIKFINSNGAQLIGIANKVFAGGNPAQQSTRRKLDIIASTDYGDSWKTLFSITNGDNQHENIEPSFLYDSVRNTIVAVYARFDSLQQYASLLSQVVPVGRTYSETRKSWSSINLGASQPAIVNNAPGLVSVYNRTLGSQDSYLNLGSGTGNPADFLPMVSSKVHPGTSWGELHNVYVGADGDAAYYSAGLAVTVKTNSGGTVSSIPLFKLSNNNNPQFTVGPTGTVLVGTTTNTGEKLQVNGITRTKGLRAYPDSNLTAVTIQYAPSQTAPAILFNDTYGNEAARLNAGTNGGVSFGARAAFGAAQANYIAIGRNTLGANNSPGATGAYNIALGDIALSQLTTGTSNIGIGGSALSALTSGSQNVALGTLALINNSTGNYNTAIGHIALKMNTGSNNTAVGDWAGAADTVGSYNVFVGDNAGLNARGNRNVFVGASAGSDFPGNGNVFVGSQIGVGYSYLQGDSNVSVGLNSGNNAYGTGNTFLGTNAGGALAGWNVSNTTIIGYNATSNLSNAMIFGNGNVNSWIFNSGASLPATAALVVGTSSSNGNGAYLTKGGVWTNASDSFKKENFRVLNEKDILDKILRLPVTRWNYKGLHEQHIGPVSQDFYRIFQLGSDNKTISTIDPSGIALVGIQALYHKWQEDSQKVKTQQEKIARLEEKLLDQESQLSKQQNQIAGLLDKLTKLETAINKKDNANDHKELDTRK